MEPSNRYVLEPAIAEKGDHQYRMINGELVQEFGMPTIGCSCARRGGGYPATSVPVTVPLSWRKRPEFNARADLTSVLEFGEWRATFVKALIEEDSTLEKQWCELRGVLESQRRRERSACECDAFRRIRSVSMWIVASRDRTGRTCE